MAVYYTQFRSQPNPYSTVTFDLDIAETTQKSLSSKKTARASSEMQKQAFSSDRAN